SSLFRDHSSSFNRLTGIPVHPLEVQQLFDSIIDPHQTHPSYQPLRGWCFIENQLISQLKIYPAATRSYHKRGERLASCSQFSTRPDVLSIFPTTPNSYHSGFVTSPMRHDYNWDELALCLETKDQHSIFIPAIGPNRIQHHTDPGTGARIHYYFQTLPPDPVRQVQLHYQYTWGELYSILILSLTGACLLSWALYWLFQRLAPGYPFSLPPLYGYPLLWLGVVIGLRILFYTAIDAYFYPIPPEGDGLTFHIVGPRFLYPVIVLYPMLLVYVVPYLWLRNGGPIETR
ncbi:MAG: hypothetical protein RBU29_06025, partial [bacterium]|nr:hypothetical protein [bacterium]